MNKVQDKFQEYIETNYPNISNYKLLEELIFYGIFVYYYYFGPINDSVKNFILVKYIVAIFILRYTFSYLTNFKNENNDTVYQLNSKIAIFSIMILFLTEKIDITTISIIFSYIILLTAFKSGYTVDNILTFLIILTIYSLNLIY